MDNLVEINSKKEKENTDKFLKYLSIWITRNMGEDDVSHMISTLRLHDEGEVSVAQFFEQLEEGFSSNGQAISEENMSEILDLFRFVFNLPTLKEYHHSNVHDEDDLSVPLNCTLLDNDVTPLFPEVSSFMKNLVLRESMPRRNGRIILNVVRLLRAGIINSNEALILINPLINICDESFAEKLGYALEKLDNSTDCGDPYEGLNDVSDNAETHESTAGDVLKFLNTKDGNSIRSFYDVLQNREVTLVALSEGIKELQSMKDFLKPSPFLLKTFRLVYNRDAALTLQFALKDDFCNIRDTVVKHLVHEQKKQALSNQKLYDESCSMMPMLYGLSGFDRINTYLDYELSKADTWKYLQKGEWYETKFHIGRLEIIQRIMVSIKAAARNTLAAESAQAVTFFCDQLLTLIEECSEKETKATPYISKFIKILFSIYHAQIESEYNLENTEDDPDDVSECALNEERFQSYAYNLYINKIVNFMNDDSDEYPKGKVLLHFNDSYLCMKECFD